MNSVRANEASEDALGRLAEAFAKPAPSPEETGPTIAVVTEQLGNSAANVSPATDASRRTRDYLADFYQRLTEQPAPF